MATGCASTWIEMIERKEKPRAMEAETSSLMAGSLEKSSKNMGLVGDSVDTPNSHPDTVKGKANSPSAITYWILNKAYAAIGSPPLQIQLWNGIKFGRKDADMHTKIQVKTKKAFFKLLAYPDLFFGDEYASGNIIIEGNLITFLETFYRGQISSKPHLLQKIISYFYVRRQENHLEGSQDNVHHHYNIGNDFYKLWLDEQLIYTCAYYPTIESTLQEAQQAKMEHICRKLHLCPGQTVIEVGCGWGALAIYMAKNYAVKVTAFNISAEQIKHARARAVTEGLEKNVEFVQDDYRNVQGTFDAFVSVGMLEHVGPDHYENFGKLINRCLKKSGHGLLHFIGRNGPMPMNAWIEKRIFPGAHPPALSEAMAIFESGEFSVLDVENLRLHYAKTLEHWLDKYEQETAAITEMFDSEFVNSWRLYLAGSIAAFLMGDLQLFQISFVHGQNNFIQWNRDFLHNDNKTNTRQEPKWKHMT